ncbi:hypothetical protein ACQFX9_20420 [Aliinostoc sp. HNIBRCY26]|uniref:hypothetical protein n=1 Tax=Aliinostoc sp. HNIBRCY26 TaxID=3418997 RepID=UPI003D05F245
MDDPQNLPLEFLITVSRIGLAFNNYEYGNETAQVIQKMLPQSKRIEPLGLTWNEILIEAKQREIEQQKQRSRGTSFTAKAFLTSRASGRLSINSCSSALAKLTVRAASRREGIAISRCWFIIVRY